ncbi:MAG TPA: cupin domain-containing protein [Candidatus Acidoferrales bacterium]|jgi:1,2-dihydroxy-3-keto-5-methylthiopentene dioxygenase|nr:cupin domain-containing protein [Candidatus Acidoferrales bacterium]
MALVRIPDEKRSIAEPTEITKYLATIGIDYERWDATGTVAQSAPPEEILAFYAPQIEKLKARGGYVTADVIDVNPQTPGLEAMLARFNTEHWHDEDEIRYIVAGRGVFHIHPKERPVVAIEVEAGDLIRVPRGTHHWFDLCADRSIRAIRLFQDPSGWTPHYTQSGADRGYDPVCFGPAYIRPIASVS